MQFSLWGGGSINCRIHLFFQVRKYDSTAIPYRASTGPEQSFPCVVFPHREKLHRENPVFNTGMGLQCIIIKIWEFFNQIPQLGLFWIRSFRLSPVGLLTLNLNTGISNFSLSISLPNIKFLTLSQFPIILSWVLDIQMLSQL